MTNFIRLGLGCGLALLLATGPAQATAPASPEPPVGSQQAALPPYQEEEVNFGPSQARLVGTLSIPAGEGPFPAVVLLSDQGAQNRDGLTDSFAPLAQLADYLALRGVLVLRFDDRGTGKSGGSIQTGVNERVVDARAALNFLRTRPEADLGRLGLVGHGEGSSVALLAATQPLPPAFVVGLAPYGLPGADIVLGQQAALLSRLGVAPAEVAASLKWQRSMQEIIQRTPSNAQAQAIVANMLRQSNEHLDEGLAQVRAAEMVAPAYRDFLAFDPLAALPHVACPVLLLGGAADQLLQPDANLQALAKGLKKNASTTVHKLPGVNHLLQADPGQWPLVGGAARPILSPALAESLQSWLAVQASR